MVGDDSVGDGFLVADGPPVKYMPIPRTYANPEASNLKYDVRSGTRAKDFLLN